MILDAQCTALLQPLLLSYYYYYYYYDSYCYFHCCYFSVQTIVRIFVVVAVTAHIGIDRFGP